MTQNYIERQKAFLQTSFGDDRLTAIHIALYYTLFAVWNKTNWKETFDIHRDEIMSFAKIGNRNTYLNALKSLHEFGYIEYYPSKSQFIASRVKMVVLETFTCTKSDTSTCTNSDTSTCTKSDTTTGTSGGTSGGTLHKLYKHINYINDIEGNFAETENGLQKEKEISEPQSKKTDLGETENPEPKKIKKTTAKKNEFIPPTKDEFIEFAKTWFKEMDYPNFEKYEIAIREKYSVWSLSGWVNGKTNEKIKNWKSTLGRTLKFIKQNVDEQVSRNNARPGSDNPLSPTYKGMVW